MKVSIMQPSMFMWNGLVKQLCDSDLHIILDHVRASKNSNYNRNLISNGIGGSCWLTIPIIEFSRQRCINELRLDTSSPTRTKIAHLFKSRYSKAEFFKTTDMMLNKTLDTQVENSGLIDVYENFLIELRKCGVPICETILSSALVAQNPSLNQISGVNLINSLLDTVCATRYLAAQNTVLYATKDDYTIKFVEIQEFSYQEYRQTRSKAAKHSFVKNLSCLDTLSVMSPDMYLEYLHCCNSWKSL
jgi:hypothetical protein